MWATGAQSRWRTLGDSVGHSLELSHLRGEWAGYLSNTPVYSGQRAAFGIINFQALAACPRCGLSGLPQSEKPKVSERQVFPGSSLQCGEVGGY